MIVHHGVYGVILREDNILLVLKTRGPYKGLWDLPGGRLEKGESKEQALIREISEETGVKVEKFRFLKEVTAEFPGFSHKGSLYVIEEFDTSFIDLKIDNEDGRGACWRSCRNHEGLTPFALNYLIEINQKANSVDHD